MLHLVSATSNSSQKLYYTLRYARSVYDAEKKPFLRMKDSYSLDLMT